MGPVEYARIAVPVAAIVLAVIRASGYFFGNYFMNIVARGVIHTAHAGLRRAESRAEAIY